MIRKLEASTDLLHAHAAFDQVFTSTDWTSPLFRQSQFPRAVLYPSVYYLLHEQYEAVCTAAQAIGETRLYVSAIEGCGESCTFEQYSHWLVDLESCPWSQLVDTIWPVESAFYSLHGRWGLYTTEPWFTLVSGPDPFIRVLDAQLDLNTNLQHFVTVMRERIATGWDIGDWVSNVTAYVAGPDWTAEPLHEQSL